MVCESRFSAQFLIIPSLVTMHLTQDLTTWTPCHIAHMSLYFSIAQPNDSNDGTEFHSISLLVSTINPFKTQAFWGFVSASTHLCNIITPRSLLTELARSLTVFSDGYSIKEVSWCRYIFNLLCFSIPVGPVYNILLKTVPTNMHRPLTADLTKPRDS